MDTDFSNRNCNSHPFTFLQLQSPREETVIGGRGAYAHRLVAADIAFVGAANVGLAIFFYYEAILYAIYSLAHAKHLSRLGRRVQHVDIGAIQHQSAPELAWAAQAETQLGCFGCLLPLGRLMARPWDDFVRGPRRARMELELTKATSAPQAEGSDFSGKMIYSTPSTPGGSHKFDLPSVLRWTSNKSDKERARGDAPGTSHHTDHKLQSDHM